MIRTIDWYIIKKYLRTFFFTAIVISLIAMVIDLSQKIDKFIAADLSVGQIGYYYLNFIPFVNGLLWPLCALIAVIFFTSRMGRDSEIISILNAGVSFNRLLRPFVISALVILTLLLFGNHYVIPKSNNIMFNYELEYFNKKKSNIKKRDFLFVLDQQHRLYVRTYDRIDTLGRDVRLETYQGDSLVQILKAKELEWIGPPNKWRLKRYEIRGLEKGNAQIAFYPNKNLDTTLNLVHDDFVAYKNEKDMMTTPKLLSFIQAEQGKGVGHTRNFQVELQRRSSEPFTVLILTLIGVSVASRKVRGGMGLHLAIGVMIGALFVFMSKFSVTFATNESLSPFLGVWIPNIVFSCVAVWLISRAQK
jgi:lipopolysaccharide export system permease protein